MRIVLALENSGIVEELRCRLSVVLIDHCRGLEDEVEIRCGRGGILSEARG
jgi:hypothetical protein